MKIVRWVFAAALAIGVLAGCRLFLGESTLRIINHTGEQIVVVYISPVDETTWGSNWLDGPGDYIDNGASFDFDDVIAGDYDVRVETPYYYWEYWDRELPRDQVATIVVD